MGNLLDILDSFNRKERFFLLAQALGQYEESSGAEKKAKFKLSENFREGLAKTLCLKERDIRIPTDSSSIFVAMDYHLDWIAASLCHFEEQQELPYSFSNENNGDSVVKGTQQDIDLLVAFHCVDDKKYHLVFIEAKAYTSWDKSQFEEKACRLKQIFGNTVAKDSKVQPHFCLMGPKDIVDFDMQCVPTWMMPRGKLVRLCLSLPNSRLRVRRIQKSQFKDTYQKFRVYKETGPRDVNRS